jgi:hypothetical protein
MWDVLTRNRFREMDVETSCPEEYSVVTAQDGQIQDM